MTKHTYTINELRDILIEQSTNNTMEGQLLRPKYIRMLYKQLGDPQKEDFPSEFKHAWRYTKMPRYTLGIAIMSPENMTAANKAPTQWRIQRASMTKVNIVEDYTRDGWSCEVQAYNVLCEKYVKHPKYEGIWVRFYNSRDCARYEYILEMPE